ncbi:hypothetical protein DO64_6050 [Burkholderia pseudomallei]|nr:hypothetical protein DO64_6050 [Burkholderia pseudomallei]
MVPAELERLYSVFHINFQVDFARIVHGQRLHCGGSGMIRRHPVSPSRVSTCIRLLRNKNCLAPINAPNVHMVSRHSSLPRWIAEL